MVRHETFALCLLMTTAVTSAASVVGLVREVPRRSAGKGILTVAAMMLGGAALPVCVLVLAIVGGLTEPSAQWSSEWRVAGYVALLLILVAANACAAAFKGPPSAVWMFFAVIAAVVVLAVAGWRVVPTMLAERVGIRLSGTSTILVPASTCRLIAFAISSEDDGLRDQLNASCDVQVSKVNAQVQLRWAGRMLLSVERLNGIALQKNAPRVTIPDAEAQLVIPQGNV